MSTLYIVATPIGNLGDISARAIETLKKVDLVLAEDTRVAGKLLKAFNIEANLESYHQHSSEAKMLGILQALISGNEVALISDAGTPGISDPGNELIDFLYDKSGHPGGSNASDRISNPDSIAYGSRMTNIKFVPIPGASAESAALSVCGFNVSNHLFLGFWPKKKKSKYIKIIKKVSVPFVYFDSPHRVVKNLEKIAEELGDRRVFVGRELTKLHETQYRGKILEVVESLKAEKYLKGEIVVVIE